MHCFSTSESEGNLRELFQTVHTFSLTLVNENHYFIFSLKVSVTLNIVSLYCHQQYFKSEKKLKMQMHPRER